MSEINDAEHVENKGEAERSQHVHSRQDQHTCKDPYE
jgi:hypothetical protein